MFFRYFVVCNPNSVCFVVLRHIYADVCPRAFVSQPLVPGSSRSQAKTNSNAFTLSVAIDYSIFMRFIWSQHQPAFL
jgi:hypothetical protein